MILIPPNTPHQVTPSGGAPIVLMTMHIPYPPNDWKRARWQIYGSSLRAQRSNPALNAGRPWIASSLRSSQ
jgi:hypothetical protein